MSSRCCIPWLSYSWPSPDLAYWGCNKTASPGLRPALGERWSRRPPPPRPPARYAPPAGERSGGEVATNVSPRAGGTGRFFYVREHVLVMEVV